MRARTGQVAQSLDVEQLFQETRPLLLRALVGIYGTYEGVEDAIQEAFVIALERGEEQQISPGWLFGVARNRMRRQHRRQQLFSRLRLERPSTASPLDATLERIDLIQQLKSLTSHEREIVVAKYYLGLTQEEIAKTLRAPRGTVASVVSRAVSKLRKTETRDAAD